MKLRAERRKRRKGLSQSKRTPPWTLTFADMITLILVFFILLFSMSQIDLQKFQKAVHSFQNNGDGILPDQTGIKKEEDASVQEQQEDLLKKVNAFINKHHLHDKLMAKRDERGIVLVLQEAVLFHSGEAKILPEATPFLHQIAELLGDLGNQINVEGHTDSRPISTYQYPSNWELSAARASSVIQYFTSEEKLKQTRFRAIAYGETKPIQSNETERGMKANRRVEIVIAK
ncbi:flagellar motor protein MotS [Bacillus sp. NPDC077027]|uniref:flagellar motor protein MotS n=1 Tax=Bacillus sp. NPDC077027 TaxID=3390548 RepID=UPI003D05463F